MMNSQPVFFRNVVDFSEEKAQKLRLADVRNVENLVSFGVPISQFCKANKIPNTKILILLKDGVKKHPVYEQNNLTVDEIHERNKTGKMTVKEYKIQMYERPESYFVDGQKHRTTEKDVFTPAHSLYLKHTPNMYCIDIDDPSMRTLTDFIYLLNVKNVSQTFINAIKKAHYTFGNTKGLHIYLKIENMPEYSNQQDVYKHFKGDLIRLNNMWENSYKYMFVNVNPDEVDTYKDCPAKIPPFVVDYNDICDVFDVPKLNKSSGKKPVSKKPETKTETETETKTPTFADARNECELFIISGIKNQIFTKMSGYTQWLFLALIIKNECSAINAFNLFNYICKHQFEPEKYNEAGVENKFNQITNDMQYTEKRPLTIKSLIKMYKDTDADLLKQIKKDIDDFRKDVKLQKLEELKEMKLKEKEKLNEMKLKEKEILKEIKTEQKEQDKKEHIEECKRKLEEDLEARRNACNEPIEFEYTDKFNTSYFNTLDDYTDKKRYFEIFVCKVLRPTPLYVYSEYEREKIVRVLYTTSQLESAFNHLVGEYKIVKDEYVPVRFINKWICDETLRQYNTMDFTPCNRVITLQEKCASDGVYNLFSGYNPAIETPFDMESRDKIIRPFTDLLYELVGAEQENFEYIVNYLAHIVQFPASKMPIAIIIKSREGVGKNVFLDTFCNIINKVHYLTSSKPSDFFGEHAEVANRLVINMNECEGKDTWDMEGRIKSFITEDTIRLNPKNIRPYDVANYARLFIFTNKPNPIRIDVRSKDRRNVVFQATMKYLASKYNTSFWTALVAHFKKPTFLSALYHYFNTRDLSQWNWKKRPITPAYIEMAKQYVPIESLYFEDLIFAEGLKEMEMDSASLFNSFTIFCQKYGFESKHATLPKLLNGFTENDIPYAKNKTVSGNMYKFNLKTIHRLLVEKQHILSFETDTLPLAEQFDDVMHEDFEDYFCE